MPRAKGLRFAATIGDTVHPRIDYAKTAPGPLTAMSGLETYVHQTTLERPLLELVKLRASFMNGCAYCVDMDTKVARSLGKPRTVCMP